MKGTCTVSEHPPYEVMYEEAKQIRSQNSCKSVQHGGCGHEK